MRSRRHRVVLAAACAAALLYLPPRGARGEEGPERGWSDTAELTLVLTGGNSETSTLGVSNTLKHAGEAATFTLTAEALRAESTIRTFVASGSGDDVVLEELETTEVTAERYLLGALYDRKVNQRLFWNLGLEGLRNELAGIDTRFVAQAGLGQVLAEREEALLKLRYALTWTREEDLGGESEDFAGLRLAAEYERGLNDSTSLGGTATIDGNLDETEDLRVDWNNWLAVAMTRRLALKVSLRLQYDNQPAVVAAPVRAADGGPESTVPVQLDGLDTLFQAALVVRL